MRSRFVFIAIVLSAVWIGLSSCYNQCGPKPDKFLTVPDNMKAWFPHRAGQTFSLTHNADTVRCAVTEATVFPVRYWNGDDCPSSDGEGIRGVIMFDSGDSIIYRTDEGYSPKVLSVSTADEGYTLYDSVVIRAVPRGQYSVDTARTIILNGRAFPLTFSLVLTSAPGVADTPLVYISQGVGISGLRRGGVLYTVTP